MDAIMNRVRLEAAWVLNNRGKTRLGIIDAYDPSSYSVKVRLQPDNTITGWMPLGSLAVGPGWGFMIGPAVGAQIKVSFQEDSHEAPIGDLQVFDNVNHPSAGGQAGPPSGEWWMVHQSGSYLKFKNDGTIHLSGTVAINVGNEANSLLTLATSAIMALFNNHVHTNGNDGDNTGAPTTQMTTADFTTVLKGN